MENKKLRSKIAKYIEDPKKIIYFLICKGMFDWLSDVPYLKLCFWACIGKKLHLDNPQTFNEKIQWLKLHDHNPEYTKFVDKYEVKQLIADKIGEKYIIPIYGVWNSFDQIDFDSLPDQFVLKCTHDSGGIVICTDKKNFDRNAAEKKINRFMKRRYYKHGREWPYKNVKPRIIAEKYMVDESGYELKDYKIHNFDGEPKIIEVDYNRFTGHMRNLYTTDWKYIEASIKYPTNPEHQIDKPEKLEEMLALARTLSEGLPYVRTDFYSIRDKIYFGEITLYHESGFGIFSPESYDLEVGSWLKLPVDFDGSQK